MHDPIESISISKFKATCLAVLERVRRTGKPVLITRRGEPIAEVFPARPATREGAWLGSMRARGEILGDIVAPVSEPQDWEALGS